MSLLDLSFDYLLMLIFICWLVFWDNFLPNLYYKYLHCFFLNPSQISCVEISYIQLNIIHPLCGITDQRQNHFSYCSVAYMSIIDMHVHAQPSESCSNNPFQCEKDQWDHILYGNELQSKSNLGSVWQFRSGVEGFGKREGVSGRNRGQCFGECFFLHEPKSP